MPTEKSVTYAMNGLAFSLRASEGRMKTPFIDNGEPFVVEYNLQQSREGFATEEAARRRYGELQGPTYHDASARILKRFDGVWVDIASPHCQSTQQIRPTRSSGPGGGWWG
jgi:hypothetical protein